MKVKYASLKTALFLRNCRFSSSICLWMAAGILSEKKPLFSPLCTRAVSSLIRSPVVGDSSGELMGSRLLEKERILETQYNKIPGTEKFVCHIRYFVVSVFNKQYKTKEINSLGLDKLLCYIRSLYIEFPL